MVKKLRNFVTFLLFILLLILGIIIYEGWRRIFAPNVILKKEKEYLYIRTGATFQEVFNILETEGYLRNVKTFKWLSEKKDYPEQIKAGRYLLKNGMSNNELINMLRSGKQTPISLVLRKFRTLPQIASYLGNNLEPDSTEFMRIFNDEELLLSLGLNHHTVISIFIPNTYYVFWNTDEKEFLRRMYKEFETFWNITRKEKAKELNLQPIEVITLASIIEEESNLKEEYPIIAGVYLNRLKIGMPLQADPTVRFALGDFQMKRVLLKHLNYPSLFNTYLHKGLPPGPICTPSIAAIDAVLNPSHHKYLYFCAKDDFFFFFVFAHTLVEHNKYARAYQMALNKMRKNKK